MMRFSLVLATVGRVREIERFLNSLDAQTYREFELIVVDQNPDDRLAPALGEYQDRFPLTHLRSLPGLSRSRNIGLKKIAGDIVAFPDDDCWYPQYLLEQVTRFFAIHPEREALTGRSVDAEDKPSNGRWDTEAGPISLYNVWRRGISYTIFLSRKAVRQVGCFDECLGIGAGTPWESGEDTDYLLRALKAGFRVCYEPEIVVYHPQWIQDYDRKRLEKAYSYGMGMGRVLKKHRYPFWFVVYHWVRPLGGVVLSLLCGQWKKAKFHLGALRGRMRGWLGVSRKSDAML